MSKPEDPCRDPASEARDDWEQLCQPLTDEERRENARKIEALSVPDRFALMFSNASEPRETPETDSHALRAQDIEGGGNFEAVHANISRRLERQRDEAREHAANVEASLKMAINSANARQTETEHAMRQRDELLEALEFYRKHMLLGYDITDSGQVAEAAIAAVKGGPQ